MHKLIATGVAVALLAAACSGSGSTNSTTPPLIPSTSSLQQQSQTMSATSDVQTTSSASGFGDGLAYAAKVTGNGSVTGVNLIAGPIARVTLPCLSTSNSAENSVASLSVSPYVISSGTADDTLTRSYTSTGGSVTATSTIQGVNVLGGLITATTVKAQANTTSSNGSVSSDGTGSSFVGLVVAGTPITVAPAANTKINLLNLGYVVLNEQTAQGNGTASGTMTVNMIHVVVTTANALNIPVNTNIIVASAHSSYSAAQPAGLNAQAYSLNATGLAANVGGWSGPWAIATLPCTGQADTDRLASASTPVGSLGTMVNKVWVTAGGTDVFVNATSSTASLNLLGGLLQGSAVATSAQVSRALTGTTVSHTGSTTFASLTIAGQSVSVGVTPNTKVPIAGLGYAIVNQQYATGGYFEVNALHVYVTTSNALGLPVGANVVVGHSSARITAP